MDPLNDSPDSSAYAPVLVDRTVTWMLFGLGVLLVFAVILSTFTQVNRFTTQPSRNGPLRPAALETEIGGAPRPASR